MATQVIQDTWTTPFASDLAHVKEPRITTTADFLSDISKQIYHLLNRRDYTSPWWQTYFTQDIKVSKDWGVIANSIDEFFDRFQEHVGRYSDSYLDPVSALAEVNEGGMTAKVWVTLQVSGNGGRRESVTALSWRRSGGNQWKCYAWRTIRPVSPIPG